MNVHQQLMMSYQAQQPDPYYSSVVALINGTSSPGLVDSKGRTISNAGSHAITTSDADFPFGCIDFDGSSSNYIQYGGSPTTYYTFPGDFTIEIDYKPIAKPAGSSYPTVIGGYTSFANNGGMTLFDRHLSANTKFTLALSGTFPAISSINNVVDGTKYIIQISRSGSTVRMFINGVIQGSATFSGTMQAHNNFLALGLSGDNGNSWIQGRLARFRATGGVARNTVDYTPTTEPYPTF